MFSSFASAKDGSLVNRVFYRTSNESYLHIKCFSQILLCALVKIVFMHTLLLQRSKLMLTLVIEIFSSISAIVNIQEDCYFKTIEIYHSDQDLILNFVHDNCKNLVSNILLLVSIFNLKIFLFLTFSLYYNLLYTHVQSQIPLYELTCVSRYRAAEESM